MTAIALVLVVLLMRHEQGSIAGMSTDDFAALSVKIVWLIALGGAALVIFRENIARALRIAHAGVDPQPQPARGDRRIIGMGRHTAGDGVEILHPLRMRQHLPPAVGDVMMIPGRGGTGLDIEAQQADFPPQ